MARRPGIGDVTSDASSWEGKWRILRTLSRNVPLGTMRSWFAATAESTSGDHANCFITGERMNVEKNGSMRLPSPKTLF